MLDNWAGIRDAAVRVRRALHRRPELTWAEVETAATIRNELTRADIPWRACAETGTLATLAQHAKGRHIALRGDIDALPITEATDVEWASEADGCMHACGHDGHAATLLATAWWLKQHESRLPGPVTLLFQPAEEGGHGAKRMIEDGALENVDTIFGWHNWPGILFGRAVCPDGPVMAANATFSITVFGKGGHASQPEQCRDPVLAASAITVALQQVVSRRLPPQQAAVVSVTSIEAPSFETVIPDQAQLGGSIRISDSSLRDEVWRLIREIADETAKAHGVSCDVQTRPRYDATVNHANEAHLCREALAAELGADWKCGETLVPLMASEDFSYYLNAIPGAFALVGANDGPQHANPCHSPKYDFNDALIPVMTKVFARLAGAPAPGNA